MNTAVSHYLWKPLKVIGRAFAFLDSILVQVALLVLFFASLVIVMSVTLSASLLLIVSTIAAVMSTVFYIRAYTTKGTAKTCWNLIMLGNLFGVFFLVLASTGKSWEYLAMYSAGVTMAFVVGHVCLWRLNAKGESNMLRDYQGAIYTFTKLGNFFLIVSLLFMAFPISPSFLAQDILMSSIPESHAFLVVLFCFSYLLVGVSTVRLYTKVFFGPHKTSHHEIAYKSS